MSAENHSRLEHAFANATRDWPGEGDVWLAFSGGADSTALLYLAAGPQSPIRDRLRVIHVNHQLHPRAVDWAAHCERAAQDLGLDSHVLVVDVEISRTGVEDGARRARRQAFEQVMKPQDILCTAHHLEDQAETMLLRMLRGSGVDGLGAISPLRRFGTGYMARPLLSFSKRDLRTWLSERSIPWIEDPANQNDNYDRVYLRREVLPALRARWPSADRTISRSAMFAREAAKLLSRQDDEVHFQSTLSCDVLALGDGAQRRHRLRRWLVAMEVQPPNARKLDEAIDQVLNARGDRMPVIAWGTHALRRFRGCIYLTRASYPTPPSDPITWTPGAPLPLPYGTLTAQKTRGAGLNVDLVGNSSVEVRFRQGGETLQARTDGGRARLKSLLQGFGVEPWLRQLMPLVYVEDNLAAVPGHYTAEPYRASQKQPGWLFEWNCGG